MLLMLVMSLITRFTRAHHVRDPISLIIPDFMDCIGVLLFFHSDTIASIVAQCVVIIIIEAQCLLELVS